MALTDVGTSQREASGAPADSKLQDAPLEGIVVLDLTRWMSGPYAGMMLADGGATVIKVEPDEGETTRFLRPMLEDADGSEVSGYFLRLNRGKRSVRIDLRSDEGKVKFIELVKGADVLLENYRPGVMAARGFDFEALSKINPGLVYCSITGFGYTPGPYRDWPAFNQVAEAAAGVVHWNSDGEPSPVGPALGDLFPSMHATSGILMALLRRARTGRGSFVDIAMYDSLVSFNEMAISWASMTGEDYHHGSHKNLNLAPYGFFPAQDGYVCIGVATDQQWVSLAKAMGHPELADDPRVATGPVRVHAAEEVIIPVLLEWLSTRSKHAVAEELALLGIPAAPVQNPSEVLTSPQALARGMIVDVAAPAGNTWQVPGSPIRITPPFAGNPPRTPGLGEDDATYFPGSR